VAPPPCCKNAKKNPKKEKKKFEKEKKKFEKMVVYI